MLDYKYNSLRLEAPEEKEEVWIEEKKYRSQSKEVCIQESMKFLTALIHNYI